METPTKVLSSDTLKKECVRWYKDSVVRESLRTCLFEVKSEDTNDLPALLLLLDNSNDKGLFIFLDKAKDVEKLKDLKANLKASGYRLEVIEDLNEFKNVVIEYLTYYNISTFYDKKDLITDDRKYSSAFELKSECFEWFEKTYSNYKGKLFFNVKKAFDMQDIKDIEFLFLVRDEKDTGMLLVFAIDKANNDVIWQGMEYLKHNVKIEVINTLDEFMYAVINYLQY